MRGGCESLKVEPESEAKVAAPQGDAEGGGYGKEEGGGARGALGWLGGGGEGAVNS